MVLTDNLDRVFKGQQHDEIFICFFRQHWIVLLKEFFYVLLLLGGLMLALYIMGLNHFKELIAENTGMKILVLMAFGGFTLVFNRFFIKMFNHFMNVGIITNKRLLRHHRTVFFNDILDAVDLSQIQNIERSETGFFENIFRFGDIKVYLNASFTAMIFKAVKNDKYIFRVIGRAIEEKRSEENSNNKIPVNKTTPFQITL